MPLPATQCWPVWSYQNQLVVVWLYTGEIGGRVACVARAHIGQTDLSRSSCSVPISALWPTSVASIGHIPPLEIRLASGTSGSLWHESPSVRESIYCAVLGGEVKYFSECITRPKSIRCLWQCACEPWLPEGFLLCLWLYYAGKKQGREMVQMETVPLRNHV